jgi:hypothetical protein
MNKIIDWIRGLFKKEEKLEDPIRVLIQKISETEGIVMATDPGAPVKMGDKVVYKSEGKKVKIGKTIFWLLFETEVMKG